jgi:anaerobic magnesium-protoporphyrin IX monomethyl ester cyclase
MHPPADRRFQGQAQTGREHDTPGPVLLVGFQNQGNLGLGYLASVLRAHGYPVRVVDVEQDPETILKIARETVPVLIGFSLIFQFFIDRYAGLLRMLRSNGVGCHFTMGGHFPSLSYQQTLRLVPDLDSVVRFEGEITLVELVDAISTGKDWRCLQGIAYRGPHEIVATPPRPLIKDLDQLPYPERDYQPRAVLGRNIMPILASRGCARTCSFCSIHTFYRAAPGRIVRTRRPAEVVREMRILHEERDITIFLFQDDDFPLFGSVWRQWASDFVAELHRNRLPGKVVWKINCRADSVDRDLFIKMREAGLYLVYMGLESGSEQGLKTLHKQVTVDQNLRAVSILKSIGLMWEYGFMLLDPSSTFESMRQNLGFLRSILADGCLPVTFCRMLPYDGTPIKEELERTGRLRGDVSSPDYDFLDPRLSEFYEGLCSMINLEGWIHGLEAVTQHLGCAWHEVTTMERLFPSLPGMRLYQEELRQITKGSNDLLLKLVEDLSYVYSDGRENRWDRAAIEDSRKQVLQDLQVARDAFVFRHQDILLEALGIERVPSATDPPAAATISA